MDNVDNVNELYVLGVLFYAMAVFSVSWLLRYTNGPFHVFLRLRKRVGVEYLEQVDGVTGESVLVEHIPDDKMLAELFGCFWCVSTWVSLIMAILIFPNILTQAFVVLWLGSVGISGFMHEIATK